MARRLQLSSTDGATRRLVCSRVDARQLGDSGAITCTVTRTGVFHDPRYGRFEITRAMLANMVANFQANVYGQVIMLDVGHKPQDGSAGEFRRLFLDGNKLRAEIELTEYGRDAIARRGMIYLSADYSENYVTNEEPRKSCGPTLFGAGLTPRPVIKHLDPIQLAVSDDAGEPVVMHELMLKLLTEEIEMNLAQLLEKLRHALAAKKLSEVVVNKLCVAFEEAAKPLASADLQRTLMEGVITSADQFAESMAAHPEANITLSVPATGITRDDLKRLLAEERREQEATSAANAQARQRNVDQFNRLLTEANLTGLSDDENRELASAADLITAEMSEDQVKRLAQQQITVGSRLSANKQLANMGYQVGRPAGSVHITIDESNNIRQLQETVDNRLGLTDKPASQRYKSTGGVLLAENKAFVDKVLAQYDSEHAAQLHAEHRMLAGGAGVVADVAVPATFERTVIREALYRLVGLQFVDVGTAEFSASHYIPYSYRDTSAAGAASARVYQGQGIKLAGVIQSGESAYPIPQKLAFQVSDELRYLTSNNQLAWDSVTENVANASRIIGEDTEQLIFNEHLQSADEYLAVSVLNEALTGVNGTNKVFALVNFPVVRPRRVYDLNGAQVGNTANPITVTYAGTARIEYDGTNTQPAGTYYVLNYNLGEIYFVTEAGVLITPPNATAITISYSRATNVFQFNTDLGTDTVGAKWDDFLYRYGLRKSIIEDDRSFMANFGMMSGNSMAQIERASKFDANSKRPGTDLSMDGNLGRIKDVPNFKTTAPGLWMGDQRIIIGERGQTRLRMLKPWTMGELQDQRDSNGRFTGKKEAYGDQYIILHTPTQLKRAYTSIVLFSATARVNRTAI